MSYITCISLPKKPMALPMPTGENMKNAGSGIYCLPDDHRGDRYTYMSQDLPGYDGGISCRDIKDDVVFRECLQNPLVYWFFSGADPGADAWREESLHDIMHGLAD